MITKYDISDAVTGYNKGIDKIPVDDSHLKKLDKSLGNFEFIMLNDEYLNPHKRYHYMRTLGHEEALKLAVNEFTEDVGVSEKGKKILAFNARFHDISKVFWLERYSTEYGFKEYDWKKVKKHPQESVSLIKYRTDEIDEKTLNLILRPILYHHEKWNGKGYYGLKGLEIPFGARIIHVIDSYFAMGSPYREHKKKKEGKAIIEELKKGSGTDFDPVIVDIFLSSLSKNSLDVCEQTPVSR